MVQMLIETGIIFLLLIVNGVFAMTEIAVVSARKARLRQMADRGDLRAKAALDLAESPNRFLSTVQIGITLVGVLAGAFGGATISRAIAVPLKELTPITPYADAISLFIVVAVITFLSLVLGELVPKRIGLGSPERIAMIMAWPMQQLSQLARPMVSFLSASTEALLRVLPFRPSQQATITEDEVRVVMQEGLRAGAFNKVESQIIDQALRLDTISVRDLMTPRPKIIWLNISDAHEALWHKVVVSRHSHFPVYETSRDHVLGIVSLKAMYANLAAGIPVKVRDLMTAPLIVPASQTVVQLLETFRQSGHHIALANDEYGSIVGLITLHDVMEAILGDFPSADERLKPAARKRDDGSWLIDGMIEIERVETALPGFRLHAEDHGDFRTLAGFMIKHLGHVPREGETFESQGYIFEVLDMDGHRVDKVLVIPTPSKTAPQA
jgi:putative hemolysin